MLITMVCLLFFLAIMSFIEDELMGLGSLRVALMFVVNLINLGFSYLNRPRYCKVSLIFVSPLVFLIFPTLIGFVEEESFAYYPFILIGFSVLPQLLLVPGNDRMLFRISLVYYGLLLLFMERILIYFTPENFPIIKSIEGFYVYFKAAQIGIFVFLQFAVYYLRKVNILFEQDLNEKNKILDEQNEELKEALAKLKITQKQLIQLEKMSAIGTLTSGVAHEINNPLNFISGGLDLINESNIKEELSEKSKFREDFSTGMHIIREGVIRASKIVNSLMNFSYKNDSVLKPMDVHQIIENTLLFCKTIIPPTISIKKDYHLRYDIPLYPDKMHQVLLSIIENAVASIQSGKSSNEESIHFFTDVLEHDNDKTAIIRIENTGPNIPDAVIDKIFDPFFTTKEPGEGTGLGMSIAYSYIQEHNGNIEVENTEKGVCFIIEIPL